MTTIAHDDGYAAAQIKTVEQLNVRNLVESQADRVRHFVARAEARGLSHADAVIVVLSVHDPRGAELAEALMPGFDWPAMRARGGQWARGLATKDGILEVVRTLDDDQACRLADLDELAVVAVARGVCLVLAAREVAP